MTLSIRAFCGVSHRPVILEGGPDRSHNPTVILERSEGSKWEIKVRIKFIRHFHLPLG